MEEALHAEYKESRKKRKFVERLWFNLISKKLLEEIYSWQERMCLDQCFSRFCHSFRITLHKKTHIAQTNPQQLAPAIVSFHSKLLQVLIQGIYELKDC